MAEDTILLFQLYGRINWVATKSDEHRIPLASMPGWTLLHPACVPQQQVRLDEHRYMLFVSVLAFHVPGGQPTEQELKPLQGFLRNLRAQSRQPELPVEIAGYSRDASEVSPSPELAEHMVPSMHMQSPSDVLQHLGRQNRGSISRVPRPWTAASSSPSTPKRDK
jgi:hypothetical protein